MNGAPSIISCQYEETDAWRLDTHYLTDNLTSAYRQLSTRHDQDKSINAHWFGDVLHVV